MIRLSGPDAIAIAKRLGGLDEVDPRRATLTTLKRASDEEILDQVLLTCFPAALSLAKMLWRNQLSWIAGGRAKHLDATLEFGAVLAGPGEFTLRALSNGKINLAQAEAIRDLIAAQTDAEASFTSMNGELSNALGPFKEARRSDRLARVGARVC